MAAAPSFAQLRLVGIALVLGMTFYTVVVAIVLHGNDGRGLAEAPIEVLDTAVIAVAAAMALSALTARRLLGPKPDERDPARRAAARFRATLASIAMLEGGCLFGVTVWMLNGNPVPSLAVAMVLLALAIVLVPFTDPDAGPA